MVTIFCTGDNLHAFLVEPADSRRYLHYFRRSVCAPPTAAVRLRTSISCTHYVGRSNTCTGWEISFLGRAPAVGACRRPHRVFGTARAGGNTPLSVIFKSNRSAAAGFVLEPRASLCACDGLHDLFFVKDLDDNNYQVHSTAYCAIPPAFCLSL